VDADEVGNDFRELRATGAPGKPRATEASRINRATGESREIRATGNLRGSGRVRTRKADGD